MEHILDIESEVFKEIKEHERTVLPVCVLVDGIQVKPKDTIKLYHPGGDIEALRVEVVEIDREEVRFALLEWMFRIETELDELLKDEEKWMKTEEKV